MKQKQILRELFDRIMIACPSMTSLVCYTEAVFIANPSSRQIRKGFYRLVDKTDYAGLQAADVLRDTFTDLLDGAETKEYERLKLEDFLNAGEIDAFKKKYPLFIEK